MGELFYWLFNMSMLGSLTGLVVLLVRLIRRIPRRYSVWLWLVPYIRFCVPLGLSSKWSLMTLISRITTRTVTVWEPANGIEFTITNTIMAANSYFPITYKVNMLEGVFNAAAVVWAIGAAAILTALAILYLATMREIKGARLLRENIYVSDRVKSPAVYGFFRPRIVLPEGYDEGALDYVLLHERAHIKYGDNPWRLLAFAVTALHWFNPLVWVFLRLLLGDMELACDERAVRKLDLTERKSYALALLSCAEGKSVFTAAFGGSRVRTRVENVLEFKKMTAASALLFAALIGAIAVALVTNAG